MHRRGWRFDDIEQVALSGRNAEAAFGEEEHAETTLIDGLEERITLLCARGMTVAEIHDHLNLVYGIQLLPDLIDQMADSALEKVKEWQHRPLESVYPAVFFHMLRVKIEGQNILHNRAVCLALAVTVEGDREVLGLWLQQADSEFWLNVMAQLKNRGVSDILIAVANGPAGLAEAIREALPETRIQPSLVPLVRCSLGVVRHEDKTSVAAALRAIYRADTAAMAEQRLTEFEATWGLSYPMIGQTWRLNWADVAAFFAYPPYVRRAIGTTAAIEKLQLGLRKIIKTRGSFPSEQAATTLLYLGLKTMGLRSKRAPRNWAMMLHEFVMVFGERLRVGD